jgi:hypothetical protein
MNGLPPPQFDKGAVQNAPPRRFLGVQELADRQNGQEERGPVISPLLHHFFGIGAAGRAVGKWEGGKVSEHTWGALRRACLRLALGMTPPLESLLYSRREAW